MSIKPYPDFLKFLNTALMDADAELDDATTQQYAGTLSVEARDRLFAQIQAILQHESMPLEDLGTEANRWFGTEEEAREWLELLSRNLNADIPSGSDLVVKDSNGAILIEGDSVTVIKDLKVKGGSSDLKRGTLVKKIHLTSDPDLIECRVNGSTLVLRTEFLKKTV